MPPRLEELLDLPALEEMLRHLQGAYGVPFGLIDADGRVLFATGWQAVCADFHRHNPHLAHRCLLNHPGLFPDRAWSGEPCEVRCSSGLLDVVLPIHLEGDYVGHLLLGQFLDAPPDRAVFRRQAQEFGCDPEWYVAQIDQVPVIPRAQLRHLIPFYQGLVRLLVEAGVGRLREERQRQSLAGYQRELHDSEERFRNIIQGTPLGIHMYRLEPGGRLIFSGFNPAADTILGVDNRQFLGKELIEAFPNLAATEVPQRYLEVCTTGIPWQTEQVDYVDGAITGAFEVHAFRTGPNRMASVFMEIGERVRTLATIRSREAMLRGILAAAPLSIGLSHERVFSWVNRWMLDELGYLEEELIGNSARLLYESEEEFQRVGLVRAQTVEQGEMGEVETRWLRRDGQLRDVLLRFMRVEPEDPGQGVIFAALNITEHRRTESDLRRALDEAGRSREQVNAIVRSMADALIAVNPSGRVAMLNPAAAGLLAGDPATLIGRPLGQVLPDAALLAQVAGALRGAETPDVFDLAPHIDNNGRERILQGRIASVCGDEQGKFGAVAILRDVTREREIERLKDEFISVAAHELRTPITSILGYAEILLEQLPALSAEQVNDYLGIIIGRSDALTQIVAEMLDLSRIQSGQALVLDRRRSNLDQLLAEVVSQYQTVSNGHLVRLEMPDQLPPLLFDAAKLRQVFDNLLTNALKFSPPQSEVFVRIARDGGGVVVTVRDQGIGMTPEQVERIFEKFYRADVSNTAVGGLGLGMSLVKVIIEGHGGRIWVESAPGVGTTVSFTLPEPGDA